MLLYSMAQTLAEQARDASARRQRAEEKRQQEARQAEERKEQKRISSGASRLVPLIEAAVKKDLSAGSWEVLTDRPYDESYIYAACKRLGFHYRGKGQYANAYYFWVSTEPEPYEHVMGNTD